MKRYVVLTYFWVSNVLHYLLGKRAYLGLFPPLGTSAMVRSRATGKRLAFSMRASSTDAFSFAEVFLTDCYSPDQLMRGDEILGAYRAILADGQQPLIVDCGANNGMATAYFADRFPDALIVAIEPHSGNVAAMRDNVTSHNIEVLEAALVAETGRVTIADTAAHHNAFQVTASGAGSVEGLTVADIVARYTANERAQPFLIKIDVEGYEREVFKGNTDWIDAFLLMFMEPHDYMMPGQGISRHFLEAIAHRDRDFILDKHNVISVRNGPAPHGPAKMPDQPALTSS